MGSFTLAEFSMSWEDTIEIEAGASNTFSVLLEAEMTTSSRFCPYSKETTIDSSEEVSSIVLEPKPM